MRALSANNWLLPLPPLPKNFSSFYLLFYCDDIFLFRLCSIDGAADFSSCFFCLPVCLSFLLLPLRLSLSALIIFLVICLFVVSFLFLFLIIFSRSFLLPLECIYFWGLSTGRVYLFRIFSCNWQTTNKTILIESVSGTFIERAALKGPRERIWQFGRGVYLFPFRAIKHGFKCSPRQQMELNENG